LVRPGGADTFKRVLTSAVDALDFKLNRLLEREANPSVETTRRIIDEVLSVMAAAPPLASKAAQVKQELIITRLAHRLGLRQETVWARFGELKKERRRAEPREGLGRQPTAVPMPAAARATHRQAAPTAPKISPAVAAQLQLVELLLAYPLFVTQALAA